MLIAPLAAALLLTVGCCRYPYTFSADSTTRSAKVVLNSSMNGEAYFGASFDRFNVDSETACPPDVVTAPVGLPDANGYLHFGAFAIKHGPHQERAPIFWWSAKGKLRSRALQMPNSKPISFQWITERIIRFQLGEQSKSIRLNEDDGPETTDL